MYKECVFCGKTIKFEEAAAVARANKELREDYRDMVDYVLPSFEWLRRAEKHSVLAGSDHHRAVCFQCWAEDLEEYLANRKTGEGGEWVWLESSG